MRLKSILIHNRAPFEDLKIELNDASVTVLSGINGTGKSTIISYIVDSFYELARQAYTNEFEGIENKYYRLSSGMYTINHLEPSIVYFRFSMGEENIDYIDVRGDCTAEQYASIVAIPNCIEFNSIKGSIERTSLTKHWSLSDTKKITRIFSSTLMTYFPAYRYETPAYLNDPYTVKLKFTAEQGFAGRLINPIEVTSNIPQIANWIMDIILDGEVYHDNTQGIRSCVNRMITYILLSKTKCPVRIGIGKRNAGASRIALMNVNNNMQIYPSIFNMSSGELALVSLFGELIKQADRLENTDWPNITVSGIVLIDEIDKHLHIKLQKEILPQLINMFPNIQFIASSHSPFFSIGLEDNQNSYCIYDLDNGGIECPPYDNELFREVYNIMIQKNDQYARKFNELNRALKSATRPIIITEGQTDWMHMKAALKALSVDDLDIDFFEYSEALGDCVLKQRLMDYARIPNARKIIGIFDRDNLQSLKFEGLETKPYVELGNSVYAMAIPLVNEEMYGSNISIEHYYRMDHLTKVTEGGRRLFLGSEFFRSGNSKDGKYQTKISNIRHKVDDSGIIDEKVYESVDLEQKNSLALTKVDFARLILEGNEFAKDFEFTNFNKIYDILREIISK